MSACPACQRDMRIAPTCDARPGAVRYGDELIPAGIDRPERCFDCGVAGGGAHHRRCAWEACPLCGGQLITCPHGTTLTDELAGD
jgi:hypothetical protein